MFSRSYSTFVTPPTHVPIAKFRYRSHTPPEILINDKQPRRDINAASLLPYLPPQQQHGFLSAEEEQPRRRLSFKKDKSVEKLKNIVADDANNVEIFKRKSRSLNTSPINRKKEYNNEMPLNENVIVNNLKINDAKQKIDDATEHVLLNTTNNNKRNANREQSILHSFGNSLGGNLRQYRKLSYPNNNNNNCNNNGRSNLQPLVFDTTTNTSSINSLKNVKKSIRKTSLDSALQAHSPVHNALLLRRRSVYSTYGCDSHQHPALCLRTSWGVSF